MSSRVPVPSRNDRCPCGSGRRYKECHGAHTASDFRDAFAEERVREGVDAHEAGRLDEAERAYRAALESLPGHRIAEHNLAAIRLQRGDHAAALPLFERAVRARPDDAALLGNLGLAYAGVDRFYDAIASHRRALALDDRRPGAWSNLGNAFAQEGRHDQAIEAFRRALALDPSFAKARWHLSTSLLALGDPAGWSDFDARLDVLEPGTAPDLPGVPRWHGGDLTGKTLLVDDEQGFGDTLQGVRHVQTLAQRGARVIVRARDAIAALLRSAPGVADVVPLDASPRCDAWVPIMSLPGLLAIPPQGDGTGVPYLRADPSRVATVRAKLAETPATLRIGLTWSGNPGQVNDRRRSCPLAALAPALARDGIAWYSLQRADEEAEIASVPAARSLHLLDERNDFDGKAALVTTLDLVVTVCTSTAHLAGALGRPTSILLSHAPDWRWGMAGASSAWYPTARLFRQPAPGDWASVVRELCAALDDHSIP
ncbi:MAG: tetratricopeptide repeat protein [Betaproteobacteria bacterium]